MCPQLNAEIEAENRTKKVQNTDATESRTGIIERALGLDIGPGLNTEQTLDAVDKALARIEAILAEMEGRGRATKEEDGREAFIRFMEALKAPLARQRGRVSVSETSGFVKLTSLVNGHRIYVSKGKLRVGRIDSTLPLGMVPGSVRPTYYNGRIASWLPADTRSVARAIELLGNRDIPSPQRKACDEIDIPAGVQ